MRSLQSLVVVLAVVFSVSFVSFAQSASSEVGPGSVLLGLCRNIDSTLEGSKFGEPADLEKVLDKVQRAGA